MRVVITGGCGFIGANLVARLRRETDLDVTVLDNESLGRREHLDGFHGEFIRGDIRDRDLLDRVLPGVDAVVHLAADTRVIDSVAEPAFNFEVNAVGSFGLLDAMRRAGVRRLVNASTGGAILGEAEPPVHEDMVARPISPYGASKLAVEGYCSAFAGSYGFDAVSLRFSNVYGPRSFHKGSVVAAFFKAILRGETLTIYGDGEQQRDFVYVEDLCEGVAGVLRRPSSGVYQLGSGVPLSVNALIEAMRPVVAPRPIRVEHRPARSGEILNTWCEIGRARRALGFEPATPLADGLARTWRWFLGQLASAA